MKKIICLMMVVLAAIGRVAGAGDTSRYALIPYPASVVPAVGQFILSRATGLEVGGGAFGNERQWFEQLVRGYLGADALTRNHRNRRNVIVIGMDAAIGGAEGYRLSVNEGRVTITASTAAGIFYGLQTLRQLMPAAIENGHGDSIAVPCVEIADRPAYTWRGMMLDVSRHFFSTAYLRKYIDMMALYKYNKLHLHLTDDQGWRIEIKKYPGLTAQSAWRSINYQDSFCMKQAAKTGNPDFLLDSMHIRQGPNGPQYGGSYTQEEMKTVIAYAAARHIEVIPEIDMPGHMMAAILLYPWLTSEGVTGDGPRVNFSSPMCPCKDSVIQFAQDIFGEIADLFPSAYIHIGGDEVDKRHWANSPLCKQFMVDHQLSSVDQVQGFFNREMQAFFKSRGKTLIGWDEVVDGGIDSSAVVMYWRTWVKTAPQLAAANGNRIVMTADGPLYFDAYEDKNSLSNVYHYNPTDTLYHLTGDQAGKILGLQANLWTENVPGEARADFMVMPRMTALAELAWTHKDLWTDYLMRLQAHYERLDRLNIKYWKE
jgi:hexosaminidase